MKLIYDGMFDEVEVPEAGIAARRGEPVDVPKEIGERLLRAGTEVAEDGTETPPEHPDWRPAPATVTGNIGADAAPTLRVTGPEEG